jgi:hypothetical protein
MPVLNIEEFKQDKRFFALFAGASSSGKSSAAASFEEPYLELDPDNRFGGIAGAVKKGVVQNRKISYAQFDPLAGWDPIDRELQQLIAYKVMARMNQAPFPYKTIGLGSLTSVVRIVGNMVRSELKTKGHQSFGTLIVPAPGDVRIENSAVHQILDYLKSMPCNVICTAHIIERWGKPPAISPGDEYKSNVILGEKLNLNDNLSSSVQSVFNDVYRFERKIVANTEKYYVQFATDFAKNTFGIPPGEYEWTGKVFYPWFKELAATYNKEEAVVTA